MSSSTLIFILPVAYHRLEFPYEDWDRFQRRSHYFITVGVPIFVTGVYLSMTVAIRDLLDVAAFVVSGVPMAFSGVVFLWRRRLSRLLA